MLTPRYNFAANHALHAAPRRPVQAARKFLLAAMLLFTVSGVARAQSVDPNTTRTFVIDSGTILIQPQGGTFTQATYEFSGSNISVKGYNNFDFTWQRASGCLPCQLGNESFNIGGFNAGIGTVILDGITYPGIWLQGRRDLFGPNIKIPQNISESTSAPFIMSGNLHGGTALENGPTLFSTYLIGRGTVTYKFWNYHDPEAYFKEATYTFQPMGNAAFLNDYPMLVAVEALGGISVEVLRSDISKEATVDYATSDGTATQSSDYTAAVGRLHFAPGERSKKITILVTTDDYTERNDYFYLKLSNPTGMELLSDFSSIKIYTDDSRDSQLPPGNPNTSATYFVRQHYADFLNRKPDSGGLDYWSAQINGCGSNASCINSKRIDISAAFFVEQEFQQTGFFLNRIYKAALGRQPSYEEFTADKSRVVAGSALEASQQAFADEFVQRAAFKSIYPDTLSNAEFVNHLFDTANLRPYTREREYYTFLLNNGDTRAQVLRQMVEDAGFKQREYNPAFVLTEYFGYLRRDPDPEGYDFWLNVLNNKQPNNYRGMVCSFITSEEYQKRFSSIVTSSNQQCGS